MFDNSRLVFFFFFVISLADFLSENRVVGSIFLFLSNITQILLSQMTWESSQWCCPYSHMMLLIINPHANMLGPVEKLISRRAGYIKTSDQMTMTKTKQFRILISLIQWCQNKIYLVIISKTFLLPPIDFALGSA